MQLIGEILESTVAFSSPCFQPGPNSSQFRLRASCTENSSYLTLEVPGKVTCIKLLAIMPISVAFLADPHPPSSFPDSTLDSIY